MSRCNFHREPDFRSGAYFNLDKLYKQLYSKHFKKFYAGKPTKKYKRIMEQLQKAESISYQEIERLMMK